MEVENKPNPTNPVDPTSAEAIGQRLTEAVQSQQAQDNPVAPVEPTPAPVGNNGGTGSDVATPKDSSPAPAVDPNKALLSLIEGSTGRKFDDVNAAQKYLSNLNSLVGDQTVADSRKKAELFDSFVNKWAESNGENVENAKKFWADQLIASPATQQPSTPKPAAVVNPQSPREIEELKGQIEKLSDAQQRGDLLGKYPFASEVKDEIAIIAKQKGVSQLEAFEQSPFKTLLEAKAKEDSQKSPVVTPSNSLRFDQKRVQELGAKVLSPKASEADRQALVKEMGLL